MRLGSEVVDLVGGYGVDPAAEGGGVGEVGVVELHSSFMRVMRIDVDVIKALGVEVGRSSDQTMDFIPLIQEKLRQIRPVLPRYAGDQSHLPLRWFCGFAAVDYGSRSGPGRLFFRRHCSDLSKLWKK